MYFFSILQLLVVCFVSDHLSSYYTRVLSLSTVPSAAVHTTVNNILIKTSWNSSVTTLCGPLCPAISLQASWQQHSGGAGNPMTQLHVECTNCPLSIGQENVLAIEQITKCAQVRNCACRYVLLQLIQAEPLEYILGINMTEQAVAKVVCLRKA